MFEGIFAIFWSRTKDLLIFIKSSLERSESEFCSCSSKGRKLGIEKNEQKKGQKNEQEEFQEDDRITKRRTKRKLVKKIIEIKKYITKIKNKNEEGKKSQILLLFLKNIKNILDILMSLCLSPKAKKSD